MTRHRILYVMAVASLTAGLGAPAFAANDVPAQAAPSSSHAIARGVLANQGTALHGADVVAVAWLNQDELAAISEGQPIPTYVIGRTKTDRVGRFTIEVDPAGIPDEFRGKGGRVDVELTFGDTSREARWNYTATPDASKGWVLTGTDRRQPDLRADLARSVGYDLGNDPATWIDAVGKEIGAAGRTANLLQVSPTSRDFNQLRAQPLTTLRTTRMAPTSTKVKDAAATLTDICTVMWGSYHYGQPEYFARILAWSGAPAAVYQQYGTDHTLGLGLAFRTSRACFSSPILRLVPWPRW